MKYILIVFKDGSLALMPKANFYGAGDYQVGARFFETDEKTTMDNLSSFIGNHFNSSRFKEIKS